MFLFVIYGVMLCGMSSVLVCFACDCVMLCGLLSFFVFKWVCFVFLFRDDVAWFVVCVFVCVCVRSRVWICTCLYGVFVFVCVLCLCVPIC